MRRMRKGFTLVELLIVIAIIGVLAAMMTMSSTSGTASAKASSIISGLRTLKSAVTMFCADYVSSTDINNTVAAKAMASFNKLSSDYIDDASLNVLQKNYSIFISDDQGAWYAGYKFADGEGQVQKRIASMASDLKLYGGSGNLGTAETLPTFEVKTSDPYTHVYMQVRAAVK